MDEFYIKKIINNKIVNNACINLVIHDIKEFEYNGEEYLNIYIYSDSKCSFIKINDKPAINTKFINENVTCCCYKKQDVINNMHITEYVQNNKTIEVKDFIDIDYSIYDFNKNSLNILQKLNLNGFKKIAVLPKTKDEFWLCSCGRTNLSSYDFCHNCGSRYNFIKLYDTDEKIQRKYISEMFKKSKFHSSNIEQELVNFRERLLTDNKIIINEKYLTSEDLHSLEDGSKDKVDDFRYRIKNMKLISKYFIIAIITVILVAIGIKVFDRIQNNKNIEQFIAKYCSKTEYKKVNDVLAEKDCGTIIYYLYTHNLNDFDITKMINSGNETLYRLYYQYHKENLHSKLSKNYKIENIDYIKYLVKNNVSVSDKQITTAYAEALLKRDKEKFTLISQLYAISKENWSDAQAYFDYGIKELNTEDLYKKKDYDNIKNYTEYSMIYHTITQNNTCTRADLYSKENIKYLINQKNSSACGYAISNAMNDDLNLLKNYKAAGGNMKYSSYLGDLLYEFVYHSSFSEEEYQSFEEGLKILKSSGLNINTKQTSDQSDPGYTPLDRFIDQNQSTCHDAKNGWISAQGVKRCDIYKKYYKLLKKNGAVCNKKCSYEKDFK